MAAEVESCTAYAPAQLLQHAAGARQGTGFADDLTSMNQGGVGADHNGIRMTPRHGHGLQDGQFQDMTFQGRACHRPGFMDP